ncbi:MAG: NADH-quinone oxidoreductase subunit D [Acidimicrobiia bacterium]|nr:MAG: NADH-quinone oxidoreductase subunit D [Acidimicrobiia bacterium]
MSKPPDLVTGDLEAPHGAQVGPSAGPASAGSGRTAMHDLWLTGTDTPADLAGFTSEGGQEMVPDESEATRKAQMGTSVLDDYDTAGSDDDETQIVNLGPQHPATHGVLRLQVEMDGETIRRVKPIIGYLHTGMEKTAEALTFMQGPTNVTRMDYLSPLHNELCFSLATERLLGVEVPVRAQAIRILMTELNRVASHLLWSATTGMDIGAISMMLYGWRDRELVLGFFEKTTGLRMNHNYIRPGGVAADLPDGWEDDITGIVTGVERGLAEYEELLLGNPIFLERTVGVGLVTADECRAYGVTGPVARASGIDYDVRTHFPYSGIEQYQFEVPVFSGCDVHDRFLVRFEEIRQSLRIVEQVRDTIPAGDWRTEDRKVTPPPRARIDQSMEALIHHFKIFTEGFKVPAGETYQAVESARGELGMYLVSSGGSKPWRLHVRGPSFANLQAVPAMLAGSLLADTIATLASVDTVIGDVDR